MIRSWFLVVAACAFVMSSLRVSFAQRTTVTYEVVPPIWITSDGVRQHLGEIDPGGMPPRAFVFPSLTANDPAPSPPSIPTFKDFFARHNHFRSNTFSWQSPVSGSVEMTVTRNQNDATIDVNAKSEKVIRTLSLEEFLHLQSSFIGWLFDNTNCGFFVKCESRYSPDLKHNLIILWKKVLNDATFGPFSEKNLNLSDRFTMDYEGDNKYLKGVQTRTRMFARRLVPGQQLVVTWGNETLYPRRDLTTAYSRITSGGTSEVSLVSDTSDGKIRLFPKGTCKMTPTFQIGDTPGKNVLTPIPQQWTYLVNTEFVPVYNMGDLYSSFLLTKDVSSPFYKDILGYKEILDYSQVGDADKPTVENLVDVLNDPAHDMVNLPDDKMKPGLRNLETSSDCSEAPAPKYLFLLAPSAYLKADPGGPPANTAQFENEARTALYLTESPGTAREDVLSLAREFFLIGCDSSDQKSINDEWDYLLEAGFNLLVSDPLTSRPVMVDCNAFVKKVASNFGVTIDPSLDADGIVNSFGSSPLTQTTMDPATAMSWSSGGLVVAGMRKADLDPTYGSYSHGHVAIVHNVADPNHPGFPMASWGKLGAPGTRGKSNTSIRQSFPATACDDNAVHFAFAPIN
jgi:hypothetical protein